VKLAKADRESCLANLGATSASMCQVPGSNFCRRLAPDNVILDFLTGVV
jgi:hypothetical protein